MEEPSPSGSRADTDAKINFLPAEHTAVSEVSFSNAHGNHIANEVSYIGLRAAHSILADTGSSLAATSTRTGQCASEIHGSSSRYWCGSHFH